MLCYNSSTPALGISARPMQCHNWYCFSMWICVPLYIHCKRGEVKCNTGAKLPVGVCNFFPPYTRARWSECCISVDLTVFSFCLSDELGSVYRNFRKLTCIIYIHAYSCELFMYIGYSVQWWGFIQDYDFFFFPVWKEDTLPH